MVILFQVLFVCLFLLIQMNAQSSDSWSISSLSVYVQIEIFSTRFLVSILIRVPLHLLIVTGRMLVCMVHNCTWARYLPATLLGLAVGQNILRALTFPSSRFPPSSLPFSVCYSSKKMPVRSWAICMLPFCHLPPTLILSPHDFISIYLLPISSHFACFGPKFSSPRSGI